MYLFPIPIGTNDIVMQARVQNVGEFSEPFQVTNGVKQGCVMVSTMVSMMWSAMLTDAFHDRETD